MSNQLLIACGVEILLIAVSYLLLSRGGTKALYTWGGAIVLCLTFCWSVVLGCVLALNDITLRI